MNNEILKKDSVELLTIEKINVNSAVDQNIDIAATDIEKRILQEAANIQVNEIINDESKAREFPPGN